MFRNFERRTQSIILTVCRDRDGGGRERERESSGWVLWLGFEETLLKCWMDAARRLGQLKKKGNLITFLENLMLVFHLFSDPIKISRVILGNLNLSGSAHVMSLRENLIKISGD